MSVVFDAGKFLDDLGGGLSREAKLAGRELQQRKSRGDEVLVRRSI
jgi:hypothetical protein